MLVLKSNVTEEMNSGIGLDASSGSIKTQGNTQCYPQWCHEHHFRFWCTVWFSIHLEASRSRSVIPQNIPGILILIQSREKLTCSSSFYLSHYKSDGGLRLEFAFQPQHALLRFILLSLVELTSSMFVSCYWQNPPLNPKLPHLLSFWNLFCSARNELLLRRFEGELSQRR